MPARVILEIAVDSVKDAAAAANSGADRIELCADLGSHGLTPPADLLAAVKRAVALPVLAMVRPRAGGFVYSGPEAGAMIESARALLDAGADGIVFGALTTRFEIDEPFTSRLIDIARSAGRAIDAVFHRAIDLTPDPLASAAGLARLGITRILSAGESPAGAARSMGIESDVSSSVPDDSARARFARLRAMTERGPGRFEVVACGGLRAQNAEAFLRATGARHVHSSCRVTGVFDPEEVGRLRAALDRVTLPNPR